MKLLIVTQIVDKEHPILGFFHRWIEEFAVHCEHVHVICLQEGTHSLPSNVTVHSLGKEAGKGRVTYLYRFYKYIWQLRHEYDNVFVHMNQVYVILGAPIWKITGKKIGLWYAHGAVSGSLKIATRFAAIIFTSTAEGMRIKSSKRTIVGQGIDINIFKIVPKVANSSLHIVTVGRISRSKNLETLLRASAILKQSNSVFRFKIVGVPLTAVDMSYSEEMRALTKQLGLQQEVEWVGGVSNYELPEILQQADIFIHDGATNSLDKVLLEAVLCGCTVISSNPAYRALTNPIAPEYIYPPKDYKKLAIIIKNYRQNTDKMSEVKDYFKAKFTLSNLISGIVEKY